MGHIVFITPKEVKWHIFMKIIQPRQALEKITVEHYRYSAIPGIDRNGTLYRNHDERIPLVYQNHNIIDLKETEKIL